LGHIDGLSIKYHTIQILLVAHHKLFNFELLKIQIIWWIVKTSCFIISMNIWYPNHISNAYSISHFFLYLSRHKIIFQVVPSFSLINIIWQLIIWTCIVNLRHQMSLKKLAKFAKNEDYHEGYRLEMHGPLFKNQMRSKYLDRGALMLVGPQWSWHAGLGSVASLCNLLFSLFSDVRFSYARFSLHGINVIWELLVRCK
jgi:hypothetical protein